MKDEKDCGFNVRDLNVLKITNIADAEVALLEAKFALDRISDQLKELPFGDDSEWIKDAKRAWSDIAHKRNMIIIKKAYLDQRASQEAERLATVKSSDDDFRARFIKAAQRILDDEKYEQIKATAMDMRR